jgi:hypothetical protein
MKIDSKTTQVQIVEDQSIYEGRRAAKTKYRRSVPARGMSRDPGTDVTFSLGTCRYCKVATKSLQPTTKESNSALRQKNQFTRVGLD